MWSVPDAPPNGLMYVITLHQPWASLIARGFKTVETRSWPAAGSSDRSNHRQTRRQTSGQAIERSHRTDAAGSPGRELAQIYPGWRGAVHHRPGRHGPDGEHRATEQTRHTRRSDRNRMRRGFGTDANRRLVRLQSRSLAVAPRRGEAIARAVTGRRPPVILALGYRRGSERPSETRATHRPRWTGNMAVSGIWENGNRRPIGIDRNLMADV